jgi:hypothetical protein
MSELSSSVIWSSSRIPRAEPQEAGVSRAGALCFVEQWDGERWTARALLRRDAAEALVRALRNRDGESAAQLRVRARMDPADIERAEGDVARFGEHEQLESAVHGWRVVAARKLRRNRRDGERWRAKRDELLRSGHRVGLSYAELAEASGLTAQWIRKVVASIEGNSSRKR